MFRKSKSESGMAASEYAIILAVLAVIIVVPLTNIGDKAKTMMDDTGKMVSDYEDYATYEEYLAAKGLGDTIPVSLDETNPEYIGGDDDDDDGEDNTESTDPPVVPDIGEVIEDDEEKIMVTLVPEAGVVMVSGSGLYAREDSVTCVATLEFGRTFKGWVDEDGNVVSTTPEYSFMVMEATTLTAKAN